MWTRYELTGKAKRKLRIYYWKSVLAGYIFLLVGGAIGGASVFSSIITNSSNTCNVNSYDEVYIHSFEDFKDALLSVVEDFKVMFEDPDYVGISSVFIVSFILIMLVLTSFAVLFRVFVANPAIIGVQHFFRSSLDDEADLNKLERGFKGNYKNVVRIMFIRELKVFLWSLLFIIPGIIAKYRYLMVPYILGENPDISAKEAFELSRNMMRGSKLKAFLLRLSFILWDALSLIVCNLLSIFYVTPYKQYTFAALYNKLKNTMPDSETIVTDTAKVQA
ncbi:MAG: DUF975 family protein [Lachnospiraceae bacterium]|nr:DUF975 family protein [Lachnospiraceae bacterium]